VNDDLRLPVLPIGQQSFRDLRENGYLYLDKTDLVLRLVQEGTSYFLARPRRMGKSLLVSLLQELFEGRQELFHGLAIAESDYDFKPFPVVRLDFGSIDTRSIDSFESDLCEELRSIAAKKGLGEIQGTNPSRILVNLIRTIAESERVALLIDEYDSPILKNIAIPEKAERYLDLLGEFYTTVKSLQPYLRFTFVTGVCRATTTTTFSGMNHLKDLSLRKDCATLLGVTEEEITHELLPFVKNIAEQRQTTEDAVRDLMRRWYNGYRFSGEPGALSVYNPHSLFCYLEEGMLENHWFETGTPSFAIDLIRQRKYPITNFETGVKVSRSVLKENFQLGSIDLVALLFQTGYLTIDHYDKSSRKYTLRFPNEEVRNSFFQCLLEVFFNATSAEAQQRIQEIEEGLRAGDVEPIVESCNLLLGRLSHHIQKKEEAFYHALIHTLLYTIGFSVESEKSGCKGRLDMGLHLGKKAYIFEFKRDSSAKAAIQQIHEKQYARAYEGEGLEIYLVGINVDSHACKIDDWAVEKQSLCE